MIVDLRSDTITLPSMAMKEAMMTAPLGDDVFGEDPSVLQLEQYAAKLFGHEAAIFCPSGTMANQIAIRLHTQPQDEVICHEHSHIYLYEGGGVASNSGVSVKLLSAPFGLITAAQVESAISADNVHYPSTTLVSIENTHNRGGGSCYSLIQLQDLKAICSLHRLQLHLDGARIFNAIVAEGYTTMEIGKCVDSLSVCLSKGLGAPVGSLLISSTARIHKARRIRKAFGGGMRQAGILAAAGLYALQHHIHHLAIDHTHASVIANALTQHPHVASVMPVHTNIIVYQLHTHVSVASHMEALQHCGILTVPFGNGVRMVLHRDIAPAMVDYTLEVLKTKIL